jgi:hypothetical protein
MRLLDPRCPLSANESAKSERNDLSHCLPVACVALNTREFLRTKPTGATTSICGVIQRKQRKRMPRRSTSSTRFLGQIVYAPVGHPSLLANDRFGNLTMTVFVIPAPPIMRHICIRLGSSAAFAKSVDLVRVLWQSRFQTTVCTGKRNQGNDFFLRNSLCFLPLRNFRFRTPSHTPLPLAGCHNRRPRDCRPTIDERFTTVQEIAIRIVKRKGRQSGRTKKVRKGRLGARWLRCTPGRL